MLKKIINLKKSQIVFVTIFGALLLRFFNLFQSTYGFDQAQIMDASQKIISGDPTLIGPRTGPASLFTGPLIYYINSLFYLLGFNYYSLIVTTLFLSTITGFFTYYLFKKYFEEKSALLILTLWAFSNYFIGLDSITWNPNLSLLSSLLFFLPIFNFIKKRFLDKIDVLLIFVGAFLGYQAHFSLLMLIPLSFLVFLSKNKKDAFFVFLIAQAGFIFSFIPTLIFDIKNNWLNLNGLISFAGKISNTNSQSKPWIYHLWKSTYTSLESLGAILLKNFSGEIIPMFLLGLTIICTVIFLKIKSKKINRHELFGFFWIFLNILIFSFYRGDKPPYYFIIQIPAFLIIFSSFLEKFKLYSGLKPIAVVFIALSIFNNFNVLITANSFSIINLLKLKKHIEMVVSQNDVNSIKYHLSESDGFGVKNMLKDINLQKNSEFGNSIYIQYPDPVYFDSAKFKKIYAWQQPSANSQQNIYFSNEFRILHDPIIQIYKDNYYSGSAEQNFIIIKNNQIIGTMQKDSFNSSENNYDNLSANKWTILNNSKKIWYYPNTQSIFIIDNSLNENIKIF